jgi:hypothetical protein
LSIIRPRKPETAIRYRPAAHQRGNQQGRRRSVPTATPGFELTGALAPLRDERFFGQVFIDYGAVAWPGEIDLAPDAM